MHKSSELIHTIVFIPGIQLSECRIIENTKKMIVEADIVEGFGSSDCNSNCGGHLLNSQIKEWKRLQALLSPLNCDSENRIDIPILTA